MAPTRLATSADYPTIEFDAITGVQPVVRVEPRRAARHEARQARRERIRRRVTAAFGLAAGIILVSVGLYLAGWTP